jgi:flagellar basal-body rod modification protein FlgD
MSDSASSVTPTSTSSGFASLLATDTTTRIPSKTLNQDDFLKLLVTQMSAQDPLNPMKDTDFSAQMAQFSSLEQTRAMQTDLAQMRLDQQFAQANNLIGRTVELQVDSQTTVRGTVASMRVEAGTPKIVVNGQSYDLSKVLSVAVVQPQT